VEFFDAMESDNYYYIVQELCDGGDLRSMIRKRGIFPEAEAIGYLTQLCNGFVELIK
jgi:serine/threonine protein kinase